MNMSAGLKMLLLTIATERICDILICSSLPKSQYNEPLLLFITFQPQASKYLNEVVCSRPNRVVYNSEGDGKRLLSI